MARGRGTAVFRANVEGAESVAARMRVGARAIPRIVRSDFQDDLGSELQEIFADAAPYDYDERDGYHMSENVEASVSGGGGIRLTVTVDAEYGGFDYLDITRFGHAGMIVPRTAKRLTWTQGGRRVWAIASAGHHPGSDWVEEAIFAADAAVSAAEGRIGRMIETVIA